MDHCRTGNMGEDSTEGPEEGTGFYSQEFDYLLPSYQLWKLLRSIKWEFRQEMEPTVPTPVTHIPV